MVDEPTSSRKSRSGRNRGASRDDFTGRSGQHFVMAELLMRKCNVAIPDVDVGEDLFAFKEGQEEIGRLQIKTGQAKRYK